MGFGGLLPNRSVDQGRLVRGGAWHLSGVGYDISVRDGPARRWSLDGGLGTSRMLERSTHATSIGRSTPRNGSRRRWLPSFAATMLHRRVARLTVGEWSDKRLDGYRTRRKSTVRHAEVHLKLIKEHFGAVPMASVKPSDVRGWTARLKAEGRADSYVYALHARLAQLFSDAVHDGIVPRNPCSRRTSPGTGKQRPYVATTEQIWALHNAVPAGLRPAILLGAHAGLRLAEAAALRPEGVDFIRGVVSPAIQWPNEPPKSDTSKTPIPIPNELSLELSAAVARGRGLTLVTAEDGRPSPDRGPLSEPYATHEPRSRVCRPSSGFTTFGTTSRRC